MIFVILGTQDIQFNRLLATLDGLIEAGFIRDEVFAQTGYSTYEPKHFGFKDFVSMDLFEAYVERASVIISHGGAGSLIASVKRGKKVIGVPRRKKYGEHVNDHQVELIEQFTSRGYILSIMEMSEMKQVLEEIENFIPHPYQSGNAEILKVLDAFIEKQSRPGRRLTGTADRGENL